MQVIIATVAMMGSFGPVTALSNLSNNLNQTLASGERVLSLLEEDPEVMEVLQGDEIDKTGNIEVNEVTFSYDRELILDGMSMTVPEGKILGIHGASGSGKSTLLKLLMRFWEVDKGSISISDSNINSIRTDSLRDMESYVTQDCAVFHDTIAANIGVGDIHASSEQIVEAARRYPVMAARRLVIVRDLQSLRNTDLLEKYAEKPVPSTVLVLCYMNGIVDARKKLVAHVNHNGKVLVSESPRYDRDIIAFINEYIRQPHYNASIEPRAAQVMAAHIGGDLKRVSSELDKLLVALGDKKDRVITSDLIEQKIGISKQYNVFELRDALINRDALKAHRIAKFYSDNPKAGGLFAILPQTFSFFQNLMLCYYAQRPINDAAIMAQLGLKSPWAAKDYITALNNFKATKTIQIISKIREIDARSKGLDSTANTKPEELLKELISFILH